MDTETTVRAMTKAFAQGDAEALANLAHDDIHYTVNTTPDLTPYDTSTSGISAYMDALGKFGADWEVQRFEIIDIIVSGDRAATQNAVSMTNRHSGEALETRNAVFWRIEDSKVKEALEFHDSMSLQAVRGRGAA